MANARRAVDKKRNRTTMTSSETTATSVESAARGGRSMRRAKRLSQAPERFTRAQLKALEPFFTLAAQVDCVFDEDDAMSPDKRQMGMGRLYRAWKEWRTALDPDYQPERDGRGR